MEDVRRYCLRGLCRALPSRQGSRSPGRYGVLLAGPPLHCISASPVCRVFFRQGWELGLLDAVDWAGLAVAQHQWIRKVANNSCLLVCGHQVDCEHGSSGPVAVAWPPNQGIRHTRRPMSVGSQRYAKAELKTPTAASIGVSALRLPPAPWAYPTPPDQWPLRLDIGGPARPLSGPAQPCRG